MDTFWIESARDELTAVEVKLEDDRGTLFFAPTFMLILTLVVLGLVYLFGYPVDFRVHSWTILLMLGALWIGLLGAGFYSIYLLWWVRLKIKYYDDLEAQYEELKQEQQAQDLVNAESPMP